MSILRGLLTILCAAYISSSSVYAESVAENPVCLKSCSGHGKCVQYACVCDSGFIGEACEQDLVGATDLRVFPILSAGSFNLTRENYTSITRKMPLLFIGFSSTSCVKCITVEVEYAKALKHLEVLNVPFARVNSDKEEYILSLYPPFKIPHIKTCIYGKCSDFHLRHTEKAIVTHAKQLLNTGPVIIKTIDTFQNVANGIFGNPNKCFVLGYFGDDRLDFSEEIEEFTDAMSNLKHSPSFQFYEIQNASLYSALSRAPHAIFRQRVSPALSVSCGTLKRHDLRSESLQLDEFYGGSSTSLTSWILSRSVPLVGLMNPENFKVYEELHLPMFLTFLRMKSKRKSTRSNNMNIKKMLEVLAHRYRGKVVFVIVDVVRYHNRMPGLGLFGGASAVPSGALNVEDGGIRPFDQLEKFELGKIDIFLNQFLAGRMPGLSSSELHEKAKLVNQKYRSRSNKSGVLNNGTKKSRFKRGVREPFEVSETSIRQLSNVDGSFHDIGMDETRDVLVLFHSSDGSCVKCEHFAPYFKKLALRFEQLAIPSVTISRFDLANEPPPLSMDISQLPVMVLLRAYNKRPPFLFYSGVAKVRPMMDWIKDHAGISFEWPFELPQFNEYEKELYKSQLVTFGLDKAPKESL